MWKRTTVYAPACDNCGFDHWGDLEAAPQYSTPMEGRMRLSEEMEWRIERTTTGILMLCPDCAAEQDCATLGHEWAPPLVDPLDTLANILPEHCIRCCTIRRADQPQGDHPESMALTLLDPHGDLFAQLEAEISEDAS